MKNNFIALALVSVLSICAILLFAACGAKTAETAAGTGPAGNPAPDSGQTEGPQPAPEPSDKNPDPSAGAFPYVFAAEDLYGNPVTEKALGEKRLFFVHYWATWCPPCVAEMPDLAGLAKDYRNDVGFLALLGDYDSNIDGAKKITESAGVPDSFIMVDANLPDFEELLSMVSSGYVPTTVILGTNGDMVGSQLIGAYGTGYAELLDILLGQAGARP